MAKRIIICCDGTWNKPASREDDRIIPSNVLKLVRALLPRDEQCDKDQVVFYDQGVGTGTIGWAEKYLGGATGLGISKNIQDSYRFLANNYVEGDEVYCFGFSRGAYTVRSLSGFLDSVGLLDKSDMEFLPQAYAYYRTKPEKRVKSKHHDLINNLETHKPRILFMGVWDTVGALGVPTPLLGRLSRALWVGFHNAALSETIENAYQALAIDERRRPFAPAIWNRKTNQKTVQQVWFAGVHRNVGGGFSDTGLSDTAFQWLTNRARECGLAFHPEYLSAKIRPDTGGEMEDSFSLFYRALSKLRMPPLQRKIADLQTVGEMVHQSVIDRLQSGELDYRPENLMPEGVAVGSLLREEDDHQVMEVHGAAIPVFKERQGERITPDETNANLRIDGGQDRACEIIDMSNSGTGGARLRLESPPEKGALAYLDSPATGEQPVKVVWASDDVVGVQFAA